MELSIKGSQPLRLPLLAWCGQLYLQSNKILQDSLFISFSGKNHLMPVFFAQIQSSAEDSILDYHFWLDKAKCASRPNKLHGKESIEIFDFLHIDKVIKGRQHVRLPLLIGFGQMCLLSSQIAGFLDLQFLQKESISILDCLHQIFIKEKQHVKLIHQNKRQLMRLTVLFGRGQASNPISFQDFFIINISERNEFCLCLTIVILIVLFCLFSCICYQAQHGFIQL